MPAPSHTARPALVFILAALLLSSGTVLGDSLVNQLKAHPSPYLAMHGSDPVHWQAWGKATLQRARRENKLLFVSSGYFSCHWCHVMQRESYQDPEIARLLNRYFIPVKLDRELVPALDDHLIAFVQRTRGSAGWPLNVFLTPEGHPLLGLTYLPSKPFRDLLARLHARWADGADELAEMALQAAQSIRPKPLVGGPDLRPDWGKQLEASLIAQALRLGDPLVGGFGSKNRFPQAPQLQALLQALGRRPSPELERFLRLTLERMATQGLRDQLGGGFFRYTVDPNWQTPHFEKMLYTNALLVEVYMVAAELLAEPSFRSVARDTLDFMLDVLRTPDGAFIGSLSAVDADGVEGGYYLWDAATLARLLSDEERRVAEVAWGMQGVADLEAGHLPVQALLPEQAVSTLALPEAQIRRVMSSARQKLLVARAARKLPRDDKRLAAWNGLVLSALLQGAVLPGGERYQAAAQQLRDYIVSHFWDGKHLKRAGSGEGEASLADYAYVAAGMLAWAKAGGVAKDFDLVRELVRQGWERFHTDFGWRLGENLLIPSAPAEPTLQDGPMPSPSAVLARVSLELAERDGDRELRNRSVAALNARRNLAGGELFWHATQIAVIAEYQAGQVVLK